MRLLRTLAAVAALSSLAAPLLAQDRPVVSVENFGTVVLEIDFHGAEPHLATESLWLRRSDDGDKKNKVLEQWTTRDGRWKDSAKTQAFFPSRNDHDQFDTGALPFTKDFFRTLNDSIADGTLARSTTLAAHDGEKVTFKLTFNPKGHLPGVDGVVRVEGRLALGAEHALTFAPADKAGEKVAPLLGLLLAQLDKTNREQDEVQSAVLLFGKVDAKGGLALTDTSWGCQLNGARAATESKRYTVSADTDASLRDLVAKLDGSPVIVRAVLSEKDASAKVIGVVSTIGWKEPILTTPGGERTFATGSTLANPTDGEARELVGGMANHGVAAEITHVDAASGFARIRAPNRKGAVEPNAGYVKQSAIKVLTADANAASYGGKGLDEVLKAPSTTPGLNGALGK